MVISSANCLSQDSAESWMPALDVHDAMRRSLAVHESGHACIAQSLGIAVRYATVRPRYDCNGHVAYAQAFRDMTFGNALLVTLAGPAAQHKYFSLQRRFEHDVDDHLSRFDIEQARCLLGTVHGTDHISDRVTVEVVRWRDRADQAVSTHWRWITRAWPRRSSSGKR